MKSSAAIDVTPLHVRARAPDIVLICSSDGSAARGAAIGVGGVTAIIRLTYPAGVEGAEAARGDAEAPVERDAEKDDAGVPAAAEDAGDAAGVPIPNLSKSLMNGDGEAGTLPAPTVTMVDGSRRVQKKSHETRSTLKIGL